MSGRFSAAARLVRTHRSATAGNPTSHFRSHDMIVTRAPAALAAGGSWMTANVFRRYFAQQQQQQQDAVNYGPVPDDLKPKPNPNAKQLHPDQQVHHPHPAEGEHPKTIGDALEEAAQKAGEKPLEVKDTRAIQSAEARATGAPSGVLGGPSAHASNLLNNQPGATLGDALKDAKDYLSADKVATQRDAYRVTQAEARNDPLGQVHPQGVAASVREAVEYNKEKGFIPEDNASVGGGAGAMRGRGAGGAS